MQRKNSGRAPYNLSTEHSKRPSATKSGPGRFHRSGRVKDSPIKSRGAPVGMVLHTASPEKRARRALIARVGRRQAIKQFRFAL